MPTTFGIQVEPRRRAGVRGPGVVYLGVFPTAIAFTTWAYVLTRTTAGRTSATTYVVPALAVVMSWGLLGEVPTAVTIVGGLLCLAGVFVTRLPGRRASGVPGAAPGGTRTERCRAG